MTTMKLFPKEVILHIISFITEPAYTPIQSIAHLFSKTFIDDTNRNMFGSLSRNKHAIDFLENNLQLINWFCLSQNPNAIRILELHPDKINWCSLSLNPNAIHLLEKMRILLFRKIWTLLCQTQYTLKDCATIKTSKYYP